MKYDFQAVKVCEKTQLIQVVFGSLWRDLPSPIKIVMMELGIIQEKKYNVEVHI